MTGSPGALQSPLFRDSLGDSSGLRSRLHSNRASPSKSTSGLSLKHNFYVDLKLTKAFKGGVAIRRNFQNQVLKTKCVLYSDIFSLVLSSVVFTQKCTFGYIQFSNCHNMGF